MPNPAKQGKTGVLGVREKTRNRRKMFHAFATTKNGAEKKPAIEKLPRFLLANCSKSFNNSEPKHKNEKKCQRERYDTTNTRVGSSEWLLQRNNETSNHGHVQREDTEQAGAEKRRAWKPIRKQKPAHEEVVFPGAAKQ